MTREIKSVVTDYGIYENGELKLVVNSYANAQFICRILDLDDKHIFVCGGSINVCDLDQIEH